MNIFRVCYLLAIFSAISAYGRSNKAELPERYFDASPDPKDFFADMSTTNTSITLIFTIGREKPDAIAISVKRGKKTFNDDFSTDKPANWIPYTDRMKIELGDEDGDRDIFVQARWAAPSGTFQNLSTTTGSGFTVTVSRTKPFVWLASPASPRTSKSVIEVQGYSSKHLISCSYDLYDQAGNQTVHDADGGANSSFPGGVNFTNENYFSCIDVSLTPGTNTMKLRCTDNSGNTVLTNFVFVYTTVGDTNAPVFLAIDWPRPNMEIAGDSFAIRGRIDDYSSKMTGQTLANGHTNEITGYSERNGYFWYDVVPLQNGQNAVKLAATDEAGNMSETNFMVYGVEGPVITMDVIPADKLWQKRITVTGRVIPPNNQVWINGVHAEVHANGTWSADNVPVISPDGGGAATFEMTSISPDSSPAKTGKINQRISTQANLTTNAMVLNASSPACGVFQLHLTDTTGKKFILLASTNLVNWFPILTNIVSTAEFDYIDTNTASTRCKFFKVEVAP